MTLQEQTEILTRMRRTAKNRGVEIRLEMLGGAAAVIAGLISRYGIGKRSKFVRSMINDAVMLDQELTSAERAAGR